MVVNQAGRRGEARYWIPGVLISVAAVVWLLQLVTWQEMVSVFARIEMTSLALALILYLCAAVARSLSWRATLQQVGIGRTFLTIQEGYLLNNILPLRLGELGRAVLMGRYVSGGPFYVLSTIAIERIYDLVLACSLLLVSLFLLFNVDQALPLAVFTLIGTLIGLSLLYMAARHRQQVQGWIQHRLRRRQSLLDHLSVRLSAFLDGLQVLTSPRRFMISLFWMLICWLMLAGQYYVLLKTIAPEASFWWALFAMSIGMLGAALPSAPSSLGVYEAAVVGALALLQVPFAAALSYAISIHLIHIILSGLFGLWGLSQESKTLLGLYHQIRRVFNR